MNEETTGAGGVPAPLIGPAHVDALMDRVAALLEEFRALRWSDEACARVVEVEDLYLPLPDGFKTDCPMRFIATAELLWGGDPAEDSAENAIRIGGAALAIDATGDELELLKFAAMVAVRETERRRARERQATG